MRIGTNGVLINEFGEILLIQRDDTRTWALPGGALDANETPADGAAREVREETGIIVMPVRLVGLYFWPLPPDGALILVFRCLKRGGDIQLSEETLQVSFHRPDQLPQPMMKISAERIERAVKHTAERPYWGRQQYTTLDRVGLFVLQNVVYRWKNWRRKWAGESDYIPPANWGVAGFVVLRDDEGKALWVKRRDNGMWNLPGGGGEKMETPWETAVRETREETGLLISLTNLTGVYQFPDDNRLKFVFTAQIEGGALTTGDESAEFGWFAPGEEPENSYDTHRERAADACAASGVVLFKTQKSSTSLRS